MNNNFINANVSLEKLLNLNALKNIVVPASDSALMLKNPSFIDKIVKEEIIVMMISDFPNNIDFDLDINLKPQILFSELLRIASVKNQSMLGISQRWGFDIKELPDTAYLLRAIYTWDKESPIIKALPIKTHHRQTSLQRRFEEERLQLLVSELQTKGTTLKQKSAFDFTGIKDHIVFLQNIFVTYHLAKYEIASLKSGMEQAIKMAETNPAVRALLKEANVPRLISNNAWGVVTPQNQPIVQAIQVDIDNFEIELQENRNSRGNRGGYRNRVNRR